MHTYIRRFDSSRANKMITHLHFCVLIICHEVILRYFNG